MRPIKVRVPNKEDIVFIVGDQDNLGGGNPVFRLKKIADHEREINVELHYPAKFKFVNADWKKEAIMSNAVDQTTEDYPLQINSNTNKTSFQIVGWKVKTK